MAQPGGSIFVAVQIVKAPASWRRQEEVAQGLTSERRPSAAWGVAHKVRSVNGSCAMRPRQAKPNRASGSTTVWQCQEPLLLVRKRSRATLSGESAAT
jgi:hypothetical protein